MKRVIWIGISHRQVSDRFCVECSISWSGMGLGLSVLIGLKAAVLLWLFAYLRSLDMRVLSIPFLYASLVSILVSIASHPSINLPMLLGKSSDGSFPIWSIIMFSPYLYFVRLFSALRRFRSGEAPYTQVSEGLYVGGWPCSPDKLPPDNPAIIDCTCEFPRACWGNSVSYLCVPTWDTRSPHPSQIESAVKWASRKREQKRPVFVHCAYGTNLLLSACNAYILLISNFFYCCQFSFVWLIT